MKICLSLIFVCLFLDDINAVERPCCTSKKFFGQMRITTGTVRNGVPVATTNTFRVDYSRDLHMERVIGVLYNDSDQSTAEYKIYNDYRNGKRYGFYGKGSTSCVVSPIDPDSQAVNCVPEELKYEATLTIGSGNKTTQVNVWSGFAYNMEWRMETTVNDCTPVSLVRYGMEFDGTLSIESTSYMNITQYHLSSADTLVIPDECRNVIKCHADVMQYLVSSGDTLKILNWDSCRKVTSYLKTTTHLYLLYIQQT